MISKNNKKIQFLPGLGEKPKDYKRLSNHLNVLNVDWNTGKIKPTIKNPHTLVGFSMGAIMACEYAIQHKVNTLILCSLTPGVESLSRILTEKVLFLVGEKEKWVLKEIQRVRKTLKCESSVIVIPGADHKIIGEYQNKLVTVTSSFVE